MIQDIMYAIKYDKINELKINPHFIKNFEQSFQQGETYISNHPIIICLEQNKKNYISYFVKAGFNINIQYKNHSFLYACLTHKEYQKHFIDLFNQGSQLLNSEKKDALTIFCSSREYDKNLPKKLVNLTLFLIDKNYYDTLKPLIKLCYRNDSIELFNIILEKEKNLITSDEPHILHSIKLSLENKSLKVAKKFLDYNPTIDLSNIDTTFFSQQAKELLISSQEKIKLENIINSTTITKKIKL